MTQVWPGTAYPLGATYDGTGTNFAIFSEVAEQVELCLFDDDGNEERIQLPEVDGYVWHAFLPGIQPGQRYGFRVHGPYDPEQGLRCNPNKLLLDPYAKAIDGEIDWDQSVFGYDFETKERNDDDSAPHMPKSVVVNPYFDWGVDRPPKTPYHETVIYEAHVKGLTMTNPRCPRSCAAPTPASRTRRRSSTSPTSGITAIELMPVHQFVQDDTLLQKGLRNYWGYNTIGFFAPHNEYAQRHRRPGSRSRSSRPWSGPCTRRASRSSSTSSTTTPPRATTSARRCRSRASTTRRTTGSSRTTSSTTWTTPAPGTPSTSGTRSRCS